MPSFFNQQKPEILNAKKRFGILGQSINASSSIILLDSEKNINHEDGMESVPESWVELAPSRTSLCSSDEAMTVDEAISSASGILRDSCLSPISVQNSHRDLELNLEQVKYRLAKDVAKSTDWIWDWSSRPEAIPPANSTGGSQILNQVNSALTTPPNSPEPELLFSARHGFSYSSLKKSKKNYISSNFFRLKVFVGFFVSNLMTFVLGATIGFCICKRIRKSDPHSILDFNQYYW